MKSKFLRAVAYVIGSILITACFFGILFGGILGVILGVSVMGLLYKVATMIDG